MLRRVIGSKQRRLPTSAELLGSSRARARPLATLGENKSLVTKKLITDLKAFEKIKIKKMG